MSLGVRINRFLIINVTDTCFIDAYTVRMKLVGSLCREKVVSGLRIKRVIVKRGFTAM